MHKSIDDAINLFECIPCTQLVVCGDGMLDKYSSLTFEQFKKIFQHFEFMESERKNPEHEAPIYIPVHSAISINFPTTIKRLGGAYNVAAVASRLGADVECVGCVGNGFEGNSVKDLLAREGIKFHKSPTIQGIVKHRIFVDGEYMCRIDQDPAVNHEKNLMDIYSIKKAVECRDEIIVSSYNKGFDASQLIKNRRVILDAKPSQFKNYKGLDVLLKINVNEASEALGINPSEYERGHHIHQLQGMFEFPDLVVTLGKEGAECLDKHGQWAYIPAKKFKHAGKYNVIGRGDIHLVANAVGDIHKAPLHIATELGQYLTSFNAAHLETVQINTKGFEHALKNHERFWD